MPVCAGYNCHKRIHKGISLFKFPKNPKLCKKWLECLGRTDLFDFSYDDLKNGGFRVCQKHFHSTDVYKKEMKTFLKKTALPTVQQYCSPNEILKESPFSYFTQDGEEPIIEPRKKRERKEQSLLPFELKGVNTPVVEEEISPPENVTVIHYCSIPMCSNNSQQQPHLQYHIVPDGKCNGVAAPDSVLHTWNKFLNTILSLWGMHQRMLKTQNCIRICSIHFKVEDFVVPPAKNQHGSKVQIKPTAYPSVDPLFESYLTAQKKLFEDKRNAENVIKSKYPVIAPKKVERPSIQLVGRPAVIKPGLIPPASSKATTSAPIINLTQAARNQQSMVLDISPPGPRTPLQVPPQTKSSKSETSYYLLPMISTNEDDSQKMVLIPTGDTTSLPLAVKSSVQKFRIHKPPQKKLFSVLGATNVQKILPNKRKASSESQTPEPAKKPLTISVSYATTNKVVSPANVAGVASKPGTSVKPVITSNSDDVILLPPSGVKGDAAPLQQKPKAGIFLRLNDLTSSTKLPNFNLKVHGAAKDAQKLKQDLQKQRTDEAEVIFNTGVSSATPSSLPKAPTIISVKGGAKTSFPRLEKQIKIEENIDEPSLQPFLPSTPANEASPDYCVGNFIDDVVSHSFCPKPGAEQVNTKPSDQKTQCRDTGAGPVDWDVKSVDDVVIQDGGSFDIISEEPEDAVLMQSLCPKIAPEPKHTSRLSNANTRTATPKQKGLNRDETTSSVEYCDLSEDVADKDDENFAIFSKEPVVSLSLCPKWAPEPISDLSNANGQLSAPQTSNSIEYYDVIEDHESFEVVSEELEGDVILRTLCPKQAPEPVRKLVKPKVQPSSSPAKCDVKPGDDEVIKAPFAIISGQPKCDLAPQEGTVEDDKKYQLSEGQPVSKNFTPKPPTNAKRVDRPLPCVCQYCPAVMATYSKMRAHEYCHRSEHAHPCLICHAPSSSEAEMCAHLERHAVDGSVKCPHCEETFTNMVELVRHYDEHVEMLTHECPTCKVRFCDKNVLKIHTMKHDKESS